ncbi:ABC transporter ATP-binding protein [Rhodovulum sp. DZ06]|uniref:ABC transporter ATP-binding protein n=1 Tax=Rhodovulum sp. DZ06 TaxID=3425126 RepID=UPI003D338A28
MIRLENVSKSFRLKTGGRRWIVKDLTMTIPRGRSLALLGRNGAGKTTLLQIIAGTMKPDRGRVIRDCSVSFPLGFSGSFHSAMTGAQNVRFVARIYGVNEEALLAFVDGFAELGPYMYEKMSRYSAGMRARLAFGVSMGLGFDVYLVDEITAVGDARFRRKCSDVFAARLQSSDVIMVSHAMQTVRSFCDAALVLEEGRVAFYEDVEAAIARHMSDLSHAARGAA